MVKERRRKKIYSKSHIVNNKREDPANSKALTVFESILGTELVAERIKTAQKGVLLTSTLQKNKKNETIIFIETCLCSYRHPVRQEAQILVNEH